ncbi:MAG: hypothetical protein HY952_05690 [Elusimicrobia bacterium]|nr:hypothetical protein [Elusimicrobiota bacterium]
MSACLLREKCRYDGGGKYCAGAVRLGERYELVPGLGVTAALLEENGIAVYTELDFALLERCLVE